VRLGRALAQLHRSETDLADAYRRVADRHAAEHDVYHMCHLLARQCHAHADRQQPFLERYRSSRRDLDAPELWESVMGTVRRTGAELAGRSELRGVLLLRDLRRLYLMTGEVEINWWMVRQGVMAARDTELTELFEACHPESVTQLNWIKTKVKEASAQVLVGG